MLFAIFFTCFVFVYSQTTQCPGTWTEWERPVNVNCTAKCGMCGTVQVERKCLPEGCLCDDPTNMTMTQICEPKVCLWPAERSCCAPYTAKRIVNGILSCVIPPPTTSSTSSTTAASTTEETP